MPKFRVKGCFKENAEDVEIILEANSYKDAERIANQKGILVSDVLVAEASSSEESDVSKFSSKSEVRPIQSSGNDTKSQQKVKTFKGPPINCRWCGGKLKKERKSRGNGMGCLLIIVGLILLCLLICFPFNFIGILVIFWGLYIGSKADGFWRCRKCGELFPRKISWYELG